MVREAGIRGSVERPFPADAPRRRGRPKKASAEAQIEQTATIGVLATALSALFIPLSIPLGPHWILSDDEALTLAESLQKALTTLPNNTYADLKKYLDRFVPWVALTIVAGQIVAPRIAITQQAREAERQPFSGVTEVSPDGYVDPAMRQRSDAARDGFQAGQADSFGAFPGAD